MARIAITADLHWGLRPAGDAATIQLRDYLITCSPDVLVIAGDIGTQQHFSNCLALFRELPCRKALVPGNHDIWAENNDPRGDSLALFEKHLPDVSRQHEFHYLDHGPLVLPEENAALVGTINWYDYSWSMAQLQATVSDWESRLENKLFSRGRHNDANFVRWSLDDRGFTEKVVAGFRENLRQAMREVKDVIAVTHHPAFRGLNYPSMTDPPSMDRLLWEAFSGNQELEQLLLDHQGRIPLAFSGHTHKARENQLGSIRGHNIGGDYPFKRLLLIEWPALTVEAREFH